MAQAVVVAASCASLVMLGALLHTQPASAGNTTQHHLTSPDLAHLLPGTQSLKFNRSQFLDLTDPCSRTGQYEAVINRSHPALMLKLDTRWVEVTGGHWRSLEVTRGHCVPGTGPWSPTRPSTA